MNAKSNPSVCKVASSRFPLYIARCIVCAFLLGFTSISAQDPAALHRAGEEALRSGDLDRAQQAFQQLLRANPQDAGAHANLAVVFMRRREWDPALAQLRQAQALAPPATGIAIGIRLNMGLIQFRRADYRSAIPEFAKVLEAAPDSSQARYLLGLCYFLTAQYDPAYRTFAPLTAAQSNNVQFLYAYGLSAASVGQNAQKEWAMERLQQASSDSAEVHLLLGKAHVARDEDQPASEEFVQALALNPKLPFAHYYLGILAKRRQDWDQAEKQFLADAALEPDLAFNHEELGNIYAARGQNAPAESEFQKAAKQEPRLATVYYECAKLYRREGRIREALAQADRAESIETQSASLHYLRAQLLQTLNRKIEAEKEFAASRQIRDSVRDDLELKISGKRLQETPLAEP